MYQLLGYYGKWHGFKSRFGRMPAWARFMVGIAALPGIVLALLSILALVVSLTALFIPANLMYRFVAWLNGGHRTPSGPVGHSDEMDFVAEQQGGGRNVDDGEEPRPDTPTVQVTTTAPDEAPRTRRQIEVKIVE